MITSVTFHALAEIELNDAAHYYEREMKGLGDDFLSEVEQGIKQILQHRECPTNCVKP